MGENDEPVQGRPTPFLSLQSVLPPPHGLSEPLE